MRSVFYTTAAVLFTSLAGCQSEETSTGLVGDWGIYYCTSQVGCSSEQAFQDSFLRIHSAEGGLITGEHQTLDREPPGEFTYDDEGHETGYTGVYGHASGWTYQAGVDLALRASQDPMDAYYIDVDEAAYWDNRELRLTFNFRAQRWAGDWQWVEISSADTGDQEIVLDSGTFSGERLY